MTRTRAANELTPRQAAILRFMAEHFAGRQRMPTRREIALHFAMRGKASGPTNALAALEKKGFIRLPGRADRGTSRGIEIVGLADVIAPLVRAHVARLCGGQPPEGQS